jgi:hypothetical protein
MASLSDAEWRKAAENALRSYGVIPEGDETVAELKEALGYLGKSKSLALESEAL